MTSTRTPRIRVADCGSGEDCPALDPGRDGGIEVTGYPVDRAGLPDGEAVVWVPATLLPEIADLAVPDVAAWIAARHRTDLLRVQTRDMYSVSTDGDDYQRYLTGAPGPTSPAHRAWLTKLREGAAAGRVRRNVHIVNGPLTDYLRFQFEWLYTANAAAGQVIRILDTDTNPAAAPLARCGDFTIVENHDVIRHRYSDNGTPLGAAQASADAAPVYAALAETAWQLATPFADWWATHPHYHRTSRAA